MPEETRRADPDGVRTEQGLTPSRGSSAAAVAIQMEDLAVWLAERAARFPRGYKFVRRSSPWPVVTSYRHRVNRDPRHALSSPGWREPQSAHFDGDTFHNHPLGDPACTLPPQAAC